MLRAELDRAVPGVAGGRHTVEDEPLDTLDGHALLAHGVAIAHGHGTILERLDVEDEYIVIRAGGVQRIGILHEARFRAVRRNIEVVVARQRDGRRVAESVHVRPAADLDRAKLRVIERRPRLKERFRGGLCIPPLEYQPDMGLVLLLGAHGELVVELPDETLVIRADNEDSFQGPLPQLDIDP
mgnify:CR=1 FL=1